MSKFWPFVYRDKSEDELSFRLIYDNYEATLRKYLFWSVSASDLEDLIQEIFLKLWNSREKLFTHSNQKAFIFAVAKNHRIDFYRKESRLPKLSSADDQYVEASTSEIDRIKHYAIKEIVLAFEDDIRDIFVAYYKLQLSVDEIAESFNLKPGTVKSRLHRARIIFKEKYKEGENNEK